MQNMRAEFAKSLESGKGADEVTEYSRSMERALLNSRAYLAGEAVPQMHAAEPINTDPVPNEPDVEDFGSANSAASESREADATEPQPALVASLFGPS